MSQSGVLRGTSFGVKQQICFWEMLSDGLICREAMAGLNNKSLSRLICQVGKSAAGLPGKLSPKFVAAGWLTGGGGW